MQASPVVGALVLGSVLAIVWPQPAARAAQRVDLELVLAVDVSGSIDAEEARLQREGYLKALAHPEVIAAIRSGFHKRIAVAYVEWAGFQHQSTIVGWTLVHNETGARAFASAIAAIPPKTGPYTSISGAIEYAMPMFAANHFEGTRRVIDISGDGPNNSGRLVTAARDEAVAAGVTINGLPIVNERPSPYGGTPMPHLDLYYRKCVIGGPRAFIVVASDFSAFARAIRRKLVLEIAGVAPDEGAAPSAWSARGSTQRVAMNRSFGLSALRTFQKPAAPLRLWNAAAVREAPSCDIGERRRREWSEDSY